MKLPRQWATRKDRKQSTITVLWMPDVVSFASWGRAGEQKDSLAGYQEIVGSECTAGKYRQTLHALEGDNSGKQISVRWIFPVETFPVVFERKSGQAEKRPVLPDWIQQCWIELPASEIPEGIVCGLSLVEHDLGGWDAFNRNGTGCLITVGERFVFFGYAEGAVHRRVSRKILDPEGTAGIDRDWIRQTRMLYRNRSGNELIRILCPQVFPCHRIAEESPGESIVELDEEYPPAWQEEHGQEMEPGVRYLHSCAWRTGPCPCPQVPFDFIDEKLRSDRWNHGFRTACSLLIAVWIAVLLVACHTRKDPVHCDPVLQEGWKEQELRWHASNREWSSRIREQEERILPFFLAGNIAQSIPDGMLLDRLQIQDLHHDSNARYSLEIAGRCIGEDPSRTLEDWMTRLREDALLDNVKDMHLERDRDVLKFLILTKPTEGDQ